MDPEDPTLTRRLARGEPEAFRALYGAHGTDLYRYLLGATGRREAAEDLLQSVWLRLVRYRRRLRRVAHLRAYLFAVARNELRRARGRNTGDDAPPGALADLSDPRPVQSPEDGESVHRALDGLAPERREVVTLKAWHHLTFAEIGEVLGISPNTAASRYRLALEDLARRLRETTHAER